ncbi:zinc-binding dehydrogenase [Dehalococcoidia bacterium]|nr:zinc-binding dehydrogenase [Dehalococcoidia bacterium]
MKATFIQEQGDIDRLIYGDLPDPEPRDGEVLVRLHATALNHLDLFARSGGNRTQVGSFPHILGCDMAGEISELGPGCGDVQIGQRVMIDYVVKCNICDYCSIGRNELCRHSLRMGVDIDGGYAQYVRAPVQNVYQFPENMSFDEAASIPLVFHTAWHCLTTQACLKPGETILINAAGSGVGSAGIQIARALHARVFVTAGSDSKIAQAKALGAQDGVNYTTTPNFSSAVMDMTNNQGVDVVFDSVGASIWDESFASMAIGGRLVNCGVTGGHLSTLHIGRLFSRGLTLKGSGGRSRQEFTDFMKLVNAGVLHGVVGKVFPLEQAAEAHRLMQDRNFFGKIVLDIP